MTLGKADASCCHQRCTVTRSFYDESSSWTWSYMYFQDPEGPVNFPYFPMFAITRSTQSYQTHINHFTWNLWHLMFMDFLTCCLQMTDTLHEVCFNTGRSACQKGRSVTKDELCHCNLKMETNAEPAKHQGPWASCFMSWELNSVII